MFTEVSLPEVNMGSLEVIMGTLLRKNSKKKIDRETINSHPLCAYSISSMPVTVAVPQRSETEGLSASGAVDG